MKYNYRDLTHLTETEGTVRPYAKKVPEQLMKPLKMSSSGLEARMSGHRSALVKIGKEWYKLKGCNPQEGLFSASDWFPELKGTSLDVPDWTMKPKGAMCPESVESELEEQLQLIEKLDEFKLTAPLYPVARYDYEMPGRNCAVSITKGDLRFPEFMHKVSRLEKSLPDYKNQFSLIHQWLGFAQYVVKESFGMLGNTSNGVWNYVFYQIDGGYALSRVDFPRRTEVDKLIRPNPIGEMEQYVLEFLKERGQTKHLDSIMKNLDVQPAGKRVGVVREHGNYRVYLPESRFPPVEIMFTNFDRGMAGEMPAPISKKFIETAMI